MEGPDRYASRTTNAPRGDRDDRRDRDRDRDRDRGARRRSRSPHRSRRDYEVDTYSSSRDYREREREDRYAGRDRRDDRGWDRDRGRRGDDRAPRREQRGDLFDDRRGDERRGGGRRDRGEAGGRAREKSRSPPPKKKEPTPDLTDVVPVLERRRRLTQWDVKAQGFETVTAEAAKLSGMFALPGAPRQQPMDMSRLQALTNPSDGAVSSAALRPSQARQSKQLFAYNIPSGAADVDVTEFFNLQLNGLNVVSTTDPCLSTHISEDGSYALLEFKTPEDATMALALDGITMVDDSMHANGTANGDTSGLSIRRPKDYIAPAASEEADYQGGVLSSVVRDTANKISVTNIPGYLTDDQVVELLKSFGVLKAFVLVKDTGTEQSRGVAFCEYTDPEATEIAVEGLNGMELGETHLKVQRASIGAQQASGADMGVSAMTLLASATSASAESKGRVIQLLNMVTAEELLDNEEYQEIFEDVRSECKTFGRVLDMKMPRPAGAARMNPGVGKIYVKFDRPEQAEMALKTLAGRKFADRTVVVSYFGEDYFDVNAW